MTPQQSSDLVQALDDADESRAAAGDVVSALSVIKGAAEAIIGAGMTVGVEHLGLLTVMNEVDKMMTSIGVVDSIMDDVTNMLHYRLEGDTDATRDLEEDR